MPDRLIDSDILIDHLRGHEPGRTYLKQFETGDLQGFVSMITVAELSAGQMRGDDEEARVKRLLSIFDIIDLDFEMAWQAGEIRRTYRTRLANAVIAAAALRNNLTLVTRNLSHFEPIHGLRVKKPYD